jgi:vancomycin resistance protein YoaR
MTGLDATVDDVYGLDFTFRNTTGNWMALETSYDGQNIYMTLRGVDPGWEVRTDGPHVTNVKKADPTPVTREDPTLPKGQRLQVESARDGMDVSITRTVLSGGQVIDQETFNSHYEPSQNVTLVGTGGA